MEGSLCGAVIFRRLWESSLKPTDLCSVGLGEGPDSRSAADWLHLSRTWGEQDEKPHGSR